MKNNDCAVECVAISPASQNAPKDESTRKTKAAFMHNDAVLLPHVIASQYFQTIITNAYDTRIDKVEKVIETKPYP